MLELVDSRRFTVDSWKAAFFSYGRTTPSFRGLTNTRLVSVKRILEFLDESTNSREMLSPQVHTPSYDQRVSSSSGQLLCFAFLNFVVKLKTITNWNTKDIAAMHSFDKCVIEKIVWIGKFEMVNIELS